MAKMQNARREENGTVIVTVPSNVTAQAPSAAPAEKKLSPKHKASRNVDPSMVSTWVPLDCTKDDNERLQKVAKHRNLKISALLGNLLREALAAKAEEFDADVAKWDSENVPKVVSVEDAEKQLAKAMAKQAQLTAMIEAMKAKAAEAPQAETA